MTTDRRSSRVGSVFGSGPQTKDTLSQKRMSSASRKSAKVGDATVVSVRLSRRSHSRNKKQHSDNEFDIDGTLEGIALKDYSVFVFI